MKFSCTRFEVDEFPGMLQVLFFFVWMLNWKILFNSEKFPFLARKESQYYLIGLVNEKKQLIDEHFKRQFNNISNKTSKHMDIDQNFILKLDKSTFPSYCLGFQMLQKFI